MRGAAKRAEREEGQERKFLHRGIANRAFERRFQRAENVRVHGAHIEDGLLHIELVREIPEAMKPRRIDIGGEVSEPAIEGKADAA